MITSTSSSQVKTVVSLQKKAKTRKETKQFVVEGMKMVSEVPQDRLVKVYFSESFAAANVSFLNKFAKEQTELVSDIVFAQDTAGGACHCKNGTIYGAGYDER